MKPGHPDILSEKAVSRDRLSMSLLDEKKLEADVLRLDQIHPVISGNKWFKLKYYLEQAKAEGGRGALTFGGPYSNHIVALACAAEWMGLPTVGVIRAERPAHLSHTLRNAENFGMRLLFISRAQYRLKNDPVFQQTLREQFGDLLIIPEGGAGTAGIRGSAEILPLAGSDSYTHILCAVGTGTMYKGLAEGLAENQQLIGVAVLKGMKDRSAGPEEWTGSGQGKKCLFCTEYHFGGYAKKNRMLFDFMNAFYRLTGIPSDFVYTAKLFYAFTDLVEKNFFPPSSRILLIHSGGLQGNESLPPGTLGY